jgi:UDP-N-acetylmuramate dehydrogenase
VHKIGQFLKKINIKGPVLQNEPMSRHTSFKIGGPADLYVVPQSIEELSGVFGLIRAEEIAFFVLGAGANILVSDRGIRGVVIDMSALRSCAAEEEDRIVTLAGTPMSSVCSLAHSLGLSGLEFIYAMPGSVGGSIWMNARCYGHSLSDILVWVEVLEPEGTIRRLEFGPEAFGYKKSPFQSMESIVVQGCFHLKRGDPHKIEERMNLCERDRIQKGHFLYPCAGSAFKNNRAFGRPSGKIIDSLGLRGFQLGQARVSDRHANIIVNTGQGCAADVLKILQKIEAEVLKAFRFKLEREILLIGEW